MKMKTRQGKKSVSFVSFVSDDGAQPYGGIEVAYAYPSTPRARYFNHYHIACSYPTTLRSYNIVIRPEESGCDLPPRRVAHFPCLLLGNPSLGTTRLRWIPQTRTTLRATIRLNLVFSIAIPAMPAMPAMLALLVIPDDARNQSFPSPARSPRPPSLPRQINKYPASLALGVYVL